MEAASLINDFQCIVIRGISDYSDSHKNNEWHAYVVAIAVGLAKEILLYMDLIGMLTPSRELPIGACRSPVGPLSIMSVRHTLVETPYILVGDPL
jgi:nucleoside phosphorylase